LSIKQPWAQLIIIGAKDVENRRRPTSFRGRFAVHVSAKPREVERDLLADFAAHFSGLPFANIIG
jgi:hypothetical protein